MSEEEGMNVEEARGRGGRGTGKLHEREQHEGKVLLEQRQWMDFLDIQGDV